MPSSFTLMVAIPRCAERNASAFGRVLRGVVEQVAHDLHQPLRIGVDLQRLIGQGDGQMVPAGAYPRFAGLHRLLHDRTQCNVALVHTLRSRVLGKRAVAPLLDEPIGVALDELPDLGMRLGTNQGSGHAHDLKVDRWKIRALIIASHLLVTGRAAAVPPRFRFHCRPSRASCAVSLVPLFYSRRPTSVG
jgi:hypothetical protein